jgi:hypothetical protein
MLQNIGKCAALMNGDMPPIDISPGFIVELARNTARMAANASVYIN